MNIDHLTLFVRIARTHNISQAGQELHLSPAVASARINKLEQELGVRLIHRTTRKVSLTEEGQTFLPHAEEILASVEAGRAAISGEKLQPHGILRVTAPSSFGRMHLVPALKNFLRRYPALSIDLVLSDTIIDLVEGGFDVAVRNASLKDTSLVARRLAVDRRIICASPQYLIENGTPLTPQDLTHHQCIPLMGIDRWDFQTPEGVVRIKPEGRLHTDNGEALRDASVHGMGVSMNATWSVYKHLQNGELVEILKEFPYISETSIQVVYPSTTHLPAKVRAFIDYFAGYFGDPPYWDRELAG